MFEDTLRTALQRTLMIVTYRDMERRTGIKWTRLQRFVLGRGTVDISEAEEIARVSGYTIRLRPNTIGSKEINKT